MKFMPLNQNANLLAIIETEHVRDNGGSRSANVLEWETSIESLEEIDTINFSSLYIG